MKKIIDMIRTFLKAEDGVTAIEYGLIAALIAVAIIVAATLVGTNLSAIFNYIATQLSNAMGGGGGS